ncbi:peptidoglycan-binding protein [Candidatus Kaiserbacteria bacterium]|nr:peptidoglycan-binding protein [Candidatus Kaiserbacteria bacterium]
MLKKVAFSSIGLLLLISPFAASADLLSDLQAQIQALLAQIAALQGTSMIPDSDTPTEHPTSSCPHLTVALQRGSRDANTGGQVSELQIFLANRYGLNDDDIVSGFFGAMTEKYVIKFQQEQGLPVFGLVGPMTRAKIAEVCGGIISPSNAASEANPVLVFPPRRITSDTNSFSNSFSASPMSGSAPLTVTFSMTQYGARSLLIDFGDGAVQKTDDSCLVGPDCKEPYVRSHTYISPGTYIVRLSNASVCDAPPGVLCSLAPDQIVGTVTITVTDGTRKCGVNSFKVVNQCGTSEYRNAYFQCYDGYEQTIGESSSCKPPSVWEEYARDACAKHCSNTASSITVTSPNGGEQIEIGQPHKITWKQVGLSNVSIALYRDDQVKQWIARDISLEKDAVDTYAYVWTPAQTDTNINAFTIYITGPKADGTGSIDDKSDAPFSFASDASGVCQVVDLYATQVPGYVYSDLFMVVRGLPTGSGQVSITGADSWNNLMFSSQGLDSAGNLLLQANQTINSTGVSYILERENAITPISYGGVSISCQSISGTTASAQSTQLASALVALESALKAMLKLLGQ